LHSVYLTSFVVGKYVKFSDSYNNIPLSVYLYQGREKYYERVFGKTKEMLRIFEELTGLANPSNKYDQTIVARFRLGGMENITATTLSDRDIFFSDRNRPSKILSRTRPLIPGSAISSLAETGLNYGSTRALRLLWKRHFVKKCTAATIICGKSLKIEKRILPARRR
jgi:hypothetical protein